MRISDWSSDVCSSDLRLGLGGLLRLGLLLLFADGDDLQDRVLLAMAVAAAIIVPAALLEDDDLLALGLRHDLGADGKPVDRLQLGALAREQPVAQRHLFTGFPPDLLDARQEERRVGKECGQYV